jgi:preprotein translocase subunit SecG
MTVFGIILVIVCLLLIGIVLVQESKGGGIASNFSSANQIIGVKRGAELVEKITWGLVIALILVCLAMAPKRSDIETDSAESITKNKLQESGVSSPKPATPAAPSATPVPAPAAGDKK